jgi:hypothetical protein
VTSQDALAERYGTPAPWRRRALVVATGLLAVAFLAWLGWTAWSHSTPEVESALVGYSIDSEHAATARVEVKLRDADVEATCLLRAVAEDHTVVGERSFTPSYGAPQPLEQTVRTERMATSIELIGCTTPDQARPR